MPSIANTPESVIAVPTPLSADKLTLALTAEDLIAQVKEQMPEAMGMVPGEFDIDAMAKGTSMSMSFKR